MCKSKDRNALSNSQEEAMHNIKFLLPVFTLISCQPPADVNEYTYPADRDLFQSSMDISIGS